MFKNWILSAIFCASVFVAQSASAGLFVTIDIGDDGIIDGVFASGADPGVTVVSATAFGLQVFATISQSETANETTLGSSTVGIDVQSEGAPLTDRVRVRSIFTDIDLPAGDPLTLTASVATSSPASVVLAQNRSFIGDDLLVSVGPPPVFPNPVSGAVSASIGGLDAAINSGDRPRGGSNFDLLNDTLIVFTQVNGVIFQVNSTSVVTAGAIPEASTIVAWSLCAGFGALVYRRRNRKVAA